MLLSAKYFWTNWLLALRPGFQASPARHPTWVSGTLRGTQGWAAEWVSLLLRSVVSLPPEMPRICRRVWKMKYRYLCPCPPHYYDWSIDFQPDAKIPFRCIYSMSEPELVALKEYIHESLKKHFIQLSTSLCKAGKMYLSQPTTEFLGYILSPEGSTWIPVRQYRSATRQCPEAFRKPNASLGLQTFIGALYGVALKFWLQ